MSNQDYTTDAKHRCNMSIAPNPRLNIPMSKGSLDKKLEPDIFFSIKFSDGPIKMKEDPTIAYAQNDTAPHEEIATIINGDVVNIRPGKFLEWTVLKNTYQESKWHRICLIDSTKDLSDLRAILCRMLELFPRWDKWDRLAGRESAYVVEFLQLAKRLDWNFDDDARIEEWSRQDHRRVRRAPGYLYEIPSGTQLIQDKFDHFLPRPELKKEGEPKDPRDSIPWDIGYDVMCRLFILMGGTMELDTTKRHPSWDASNNIIDGLARRGITPQNPYTFCVEFENEMGKWWNEQSDAERGPILANLEMVKQLPRESRLKSSMRTTRPEDLLPMIYEEVPWIKPFKLHLVSFLRHVSYPLMVNPDLVDFKRWREELPGLDRIKKALQTNLPQTSFDNQLIYLKKTLSPGIVWHRFCKRKRWTIGVSNPSEHRVLLSMKDNGVYSLIHVESAHTSLIGNPNGVNPPQELTEYVFGPAIVVSGQFFVHKSLQFRVNGRLNGEANGKRTDKGKGPRLADQYVGYRVGESSETKKSIAIDDDFAPWFKRRQLDEGYFFSGPSLNDQPSKVLLKQKKFNVVDNYWAVDLEGNRAPISEGSLQRLVNSDGQRLEPRTLGAQLLGSMSHASQPNERSGVSRHPNGDVVLHAFTGQGMTMDEFRELIISGTAFLGLRFKDIPRDEVWANDGGGSIFHAFIDANGVSSLLASGKVKGQPYPLEWETVQSRPIADAIVIKVNPRTTLAVCNETGRPIGRLRKHPTAETGRPIGLLRKRPTVETSRPTNRLRKRPTAR